MICDAASTVARSYGLFVVLGLVLGGYFIRTWLLSQHGRRVWERSLLRAPIVGKLIAQFAMARFCRMLGTLLAAGVPLINGLNVARKAPNEQG